MDRDTFWGYIEDFEGPDIDSILRYKESDVVNEPNRNLELPIFYAIKTDDIELFKALLQFTKIDLNLEYNTYIPIFYIIQFWEQNENSKEMFKLLLEDPRVDKNAIDISGNHVVHEFIRITDNLEEIKKFLFYNIFDLTVLNTDGETPLDMICRLADAEFLDEVLSAVQDRGDVSDMIYDGVYIAVKKNDYKMLQVLSKRDAISFRNMTRNNVLIFALATEARFNSIILRTLLYTEYVPINQVDYFGNTALHYACKNKIPTKILDLILAYPDINVNIQNKEGITAWQFAIDVKYTYASKKLLDVNNPNVIYRKYGFVKEQLENVFPLVSFRFTLKSSLHPKNYMEFKTDRRQGIFYEDVNLGDDMYNAFKEYLQYYDSQVLFNKNLSNEDLGTILQYQFRGDRLANNFLSLKQNYVKNTSESRANEDLYRNVLSRAFIENETFPLLVQYCRKIGFNYESLQFNVNLFNRPMEDLFDLPMKDLLDLTAEFVRDLNSIISRAPVCQLPVYAWRGLKSKFSRQSRADKWEGFQSMTYDYAITGPPFRETLESCCLLNIRIDPSVNMYFYMYGLDESEILLNSNMDYEIQSIDDLDVKRFKKKNIDPSNVQILEIKSGSKRRRI